MDKFVRNGFRIALIAGAAVFTLLFPMAWLLTGPILGFEAYKVMFSLFSGKDPMLDGDSSSRKEERQAHLRQRTEMREARRSGNRQKRLYEQDLRSRHFDSAEGWHVEGMPRGFEPRIEDRFSRELSIKAAGIEGLVKAERTSRGVSFSFPVPRDAARAELLRTLVSSERGRASIVVDGQGREVVRCRDVDLVASFIREAYPLSERKYVREVEQVRQYVVEGCSSFEEARQKFEQDRLSYEPRARMTTERSGFEGEQQDVRSNGALIDSASVVTLPLGAYVITEKSVDRSEAPVLIPSDVRGESELREFAECALRNSPDRRDEQSTSLSDGTPQDVRRVVSDGKGNEILMRDVSSSDGLRAFAVFSDAADFDSVAARGVLPRHTVVTVGKEPPKGKFVLELDLSDPGNVSGIVPQVGPREAVVREAGKYGVSRADLNWSVLRDDVTMNGYALGRLDADFSLKGSRLNGVPLEDFSERMGSSRLVKMDSEMASRWLEDAAKIESVTLVVDPKFSQMRIISVVGGVEKTVTRPLNEKELSSLQARGRVSRSELKDLLMQTHPDFFRTYRAVRSSSQAKARSVVADPWSDFISGGSVTLREKASSQRVRAARTESVRIRPSGV